MRPHVQGVAALLASFVFAGLAGVGAAATATSATASGLYGATVVRDSDQITILVRLNHPALHLETAGAPSQLPAGGGTVTFSYVVTNVGNVVIDGLSVADSACAPAGYESGDANLNGRLELSETWRFSCSTTISKTTKTLARVSGNVKGSGLHDDAGTTVTVAFGAPSIQVAASASPASLPAGGGAVTYTYDVTAGGTPLTDVAVTAPGCAGASPTGGDADANGRLDPGETWRFTCLVVVARSGTTVATASAKAGPTTVTANATTDVTVEEVVAVPGPTPTPSPRPTTAPDVSATPTPAPTSTPLATPEPSPSPTPTASPVPTEMPTAGPSDTNRSDTSGASGPLGGSVAGVTSPPRPTAGPGEIGTGPQSTPSAPALILIVLIGIAATGLILRLGNWATPR